MLGMDPSSGARELRERVGIVLQQCGVQSELTVAELIEMYGRYYSRRRPVDELIELVELEREARRAGEASSPAASAGGSTWRSRSSAIRTSSSSTSRPRGSIPARGGSAWSTIRSLCELGKTIFLTTHYMDEAQFLADRVAVMRAGRDHRERPARRARRPRPAAGGDPLPAAERVVARRSARGAGVERSLDGDRVLVLTTEPVSATQRITSWALERERRARSTSR